tara:strand:- start:49 stop:567 length:519 start_codon:yes stop_codon:yes gene_type:complete
MKFNFLKKHINKKYQKTVITNKEFLSVYKFKKKIISKYKDEKLKKMKFKNQNNISDKINTELFLKKSLFKNTSKKICFKLYQKFSVHLSLKAEYSKKLIKISNKKTNFESYIYLGFLIKKFDFLNAAQELNFLLKINDICLLNYNKIKNLNDRIIFTKNIQREFHLLKKLIK